MRIVRGFFVFAVVMFIGALGQPASAQEDYPAPPPSLVLSAGTVEVGVTLGISGFDFGPNEDITIEINFTSAQGAAFDTEQRGGGSVIEARNVPPLSAHTDSNGTFHTSVVHDQVGTAVHTATGVESGRTASATATIVPAGSKLPVTGTQTGPQILTFALVGVTAVIIGGILIWRLVVRQRSRTAGRV